MKSSKLNTISMNAFNMNTINTNENEAPAHYIASIIVPLLADNKCVIWLVSGGSALTVAVRARQLIGKAVTTDQLHVGLADERYGSPGHADSNYQQLIDAGFLTKNVIMHPVLAGKDTAQTAASYAATLGYLLNKSDAAIGLFGMGKDGHTAGLLPDNPIMQKPNLADYYIAPDFERISITPLCIGRLDAAVLYAVGKDKWPALKTLENSASERLPVCALKKAASLIVYSDYKGGSS